MGTALLCCRACFGVGRDELDAGQPALDHRVQGVSAAAADTDDLDGGLLAGCLIEFEHVVRVLGPDLEQIEAIARLDVVADERVLGRLVLVLSHFVLPARLRAGFVACAAAAAAIATTSAACSALGHPFTPPESADY